MYLGIDLGTSNSAIVGSDGGVLRHFKTPDGTDVLPSAVMLDRRGSMLVGKRAYDQSAFSPENVALGFKRLMGTASKLSFANGREMTPEEASAEIIRSLIAQARMSAGNFEIQGVVVTTPAAFNQMQSEATMRAADAAGAARVALLQEPIAAALASIAQSKSKNGQFLVYDLGGGTFDAAIVQTISATATVIAHAGINMLGGRDFDRSIMNSVVRPWLLEHYDLPDDFQKDPIYQRLVRVAQYRAELSKIALSTQQSDRIFADESQIGAIDRSGKEIFLDVEMTREQLEQFVVEDIDRSIDLCRNLIKESGYQSADIDRVVLIGGPSRMPIVRERIGRELGIRPDLDTDPMTSVAAGAAIYAESREWTETGATAKRSRTSGSLSQKLDIRYDYPARTTEQQFRIRVQVGNAATANGSRIQVTSSQGWVSGQLNVDSVTEIRGVPLVKIGENRFKIVVTNAAGASIADAEIAVVRTESNATGMPLTHNLAVKVVGNLGGVEGNTLHTFVKKGTILPKQGIEPLRASRDFRSGDGSQLEFEVYQQAEGVTDPSLNLPVGAFRILANELERGEIIRRGDQVILHWAIDQNGLLNCKLQFPELSQTYDIGKMYVSSSGHRNFDGEEGHRLVSQAIADAKHDLDSLEQSLGSQAAESIQRARARLQKQQEAISFTNEADARRSVAEESLLIRQEAARIRNHPDNIRATLRSDIDQFVEEFAVSVSAAIDQKVNAQIHRLAGSAREALNKAGPNAVEDARKTFDEIRGILVAALAKTPGFWVGRFESLCEERTSAIDKELHDRLARDGEAAISANDVESLRNITFQMSDNQVRSGGPGRSEILAGLRRD